MEETQGFIITWQHIAGAVGFVALLLGIVGKWKSIVSSFRKDATYQAEIDSSQDHKLEQLDLKMQKEVDMLKLQLDNNRHAIEEIKRNIEKADSQTFDEIKTLRKEVQAMGAQLNEALLHIRK